MEKIQNGYTYIYHRWWPINCKTCSGLAKTCRVWDLYSCWWCQWPKISKSLKTGFNHFWSDVTWVGWVYLLSRLRSDSDVYVILLTARAVKKDVHFGLSVGPDDYVTNPFREGELVARIKFANLRMQADNSSIERLIDWAAWWKIYSNWAGLILVHKS